MELSHQSFGGNIFRPQPEILLNKNSNLFAIVTPWGLSHQTKDVLDFMSQNYETFSTDEEATSVFPKLQSLSPKENALRALALSCNKWIFKEQNNEQDYLFGYEMVCGVIIENEILFVQIGHPFIYLDRPNIPLQSLGHVLDLSGGFSRFEENLPPLPSQLIGLYPDTHFSIFRVPIKKEDRILFVSRAFVSGHILEMGREKRTLEDLSLLFSNENKDMPFWTGILEI